MSSVYNTPGATLSESNVRAEYLLSADQLTEGVESGSLQLQRRSTYGSSYRLFVRSEVAAYARLVGPDLQLKAARDASMVKENLVANRSRLSVVVCELGGIDARKAALIREKGQLEEWLLANDPKAAAQAVKDQAKAAKEEAKVAKEEAKAAKEEAKVAKAAAKAGAHPKSAAQMKRKLGDDDDEVAYVYID